MCGFVFILMAQAAGFAIYVKWCEMQTDHVNEQMCSWSWGSENLTGTTQPDGWFWPDRQCQGIAHSYEQLLKFFWIVPVHLGFASFTYFSVLFSLLVSTVATSAYLLPPRPVDRTYALHSVDLTCSAHADCVGVNGPTTWNSLPPALRAPELSQNAFTCALKMQLLSDLVTRLPSRSDAFCWQFSSWPENSSFLILLAYTAH